jgi:hypothetical protein
MRYNRTSLVQGEYKTNGGDADGDDWLLLDSDERKVQDNQEEYIAPPLTISSGLLTSSSALSIKRRNGKETRQPE